MPDDVKIPVGTPGAKRARKDLEGVAAAEQKVGRAGKRAGREAAEGAEQAEGKLARWAGALKTLVVGFVGVAGLRRALQAIVAEMNRIDRASREAAQSMTAVLSLSALRGERKETQEAMKAMAIAAGRPLGQVSAAYYTLLGGTAGMGRQRQMGLMEQALLMAKTDPSANLNALVGLFTTLASQQQQLSPLQIGNLLSRTIEQAKATPEEMAQYLPSILTTARVGGVPIPTAAAMFTFGTRRGGGVAESGTAIRAAMLGLLAPSPDVAKQLAQYGFPTGGGLMARLGWLRQRGAELPAETVAALGGRRGLEAIAGIAEAPRAFAAEVGVMGRAVGARGSLLGRRLMQMYGESPQQMLLAALQQYEVALAMEDVKPETLARQLEAAEFRLRMRREKWPLVGRWYGQAAMGAGRVLGAMDYTPEEAAEKAEYLRQSMRLYGTAVEPGAGQTNNFSGTHYWGAYTDPAGRPRVPMAP